MTHSSLYEDDILLWSEQQAAIVRKLGRTRRDLPNEFDVENVAEEIESVGRSELSTVEGHVRLIFVHLIKLFAEAGLGRRAPLAERSLRVSFGDAATLRASMRQRIDMDELWRSAREQSLLGYDGTENQLVAGLPTQSPFNLDDLLGERIDSPGMVERLRQTAALQRRGRISESKLPAFAGRCKCVSPATAASRLSSFIFQTTSRQELRPASAAVGGRCPESYPWLAFVQCL